MKISSLLASLVVALPSVLATVVPTSNSIGRALTASDADTVDVAARLTSSSESPVRRQDDTDVLTLGEIEAVIQGCQAQDRGDTDYDCEKYGAVIAGSERWGPQGWVWASVRSNHEANLSGEKNKNWFHIELAVPADDGNIWSTGHIDFYVFQTGSLEWWPSTNPKEKSHINAIPVQPTEQNGGHLKAYWD